MSKEIIINSEKHGIFSILIDEDDYEIFSKHHWCISGNGYAVRSRNRFDDQTKDKTLYLHREILGLTNGDCHAVDHINRNRLDNRKENLRICTQQHNASNREKYNKSSNYKGVYLDERNGKYVACITYNKKKIMIGKFETAVEAAKAYDYYAVKYFGEFACTNFNDVASDFSYKKKDGRNEKTGLYGIYKKSCGGYEAYASTKYLCKTKNISDAIKIRNEYIIDNNLDLKLNEEI